MKPISLISVLALLLAVPSHGQDLNRDSVPTANVYSEADEIPFFPGGTTNLQRFVEKNFIYPVEAWRDTLYKNKSVLQFIVRRDGVVCGLKDTGMHPALYKEWKRVFSIMPLWEPARIKGYPVDVEYNLAIPPFRLDTKLPFHIDKKMNYLKKYVDINKKYGKGLDREEAENLMKELDEVFLYNPDLVTVFMPLAQLSVSLNELDKAMDVTQNGIKRMYEQIGRQANSLFTDTYTDRHFDGMACMNAALTYALIRDITGGEEEEKEAYEYARDVIDERLVLQDINISKEDNNEDYYLRLRLMAEMRNIAVLSPSMRGNILSGPERESIYRYGWVGTKTVNDINAAMKEGKIDNPRIRQINRQLEELEEESGKKSSLGKDSLYLYGLRAMVMDLAEGQEGLNRYVNDMCQREDVGKELKSYLSKLSEKRRKYASVLEDREAVVHSLASYAPINEEGEDKSECKRRADEFYKCRDAMKAVYPLEWLWKR